MRRKRVIVLALCTAFLATGLLAFASGTEEKTATATTVSEAPFVCNGVTMPFKRSETMVMDQSQFTIFDSFNHFIPNGYEFPSGFEQLCIEYLWYANFATGEIVPWLATGYKYNADYTQLTINLNPKAKWSDGVAFTSADVVYTYELRRDNAGLQSPDPDGVISSVKAADANTVVYSFKSPQPRFHTKFYCAICTANLAVSVVPKHIWEKVADPKTFKDNPPTYTGPYKLLKVYPEQKIFVWVRNENYWNKDKYFPKPKYVVYRSTPTVSEQQLAEIKTNSSDAFGWDVKLYQQKKADFPQLSMVEYLDPCPRAIWYNKSKAPFNIPEFARALSMLANREKMGKNLWVPPSRPAYGLWSDFRNLDKYINKDSLKKWKTLDYNPQEALKLMASVGYKKDGDILKDPQGKPVQIAIGCPSKQTDIEYMLAQAWAEEMKAVGIDASVTGYESSVWWGKEDMADFDVGVWWMCGATLDPLPILSEYTSESYAPPGKLPTKNWERYQNKAYDEVVFQIARITPDDPAATPLYLKAYDMWMQDPPGVPLIQTIYTQFFNTTYWKNMPSMDNLYTVPFNWWGQFMFVTFNVQPAK
jgi:peptide/nickel transport system substrate-binding protein